MVGHNGHCLGKVRTERLQKAARTMIIGTMRATPTKVLEMLLDWPTLGTAVKSVALMAAYRLPRPDLRNPGREHNQTWAKAYKWTVNSL